MYNCATISVGVVAASARAACQRWLCRISRPAFAAHISVAIVWLALLSNRIYAQNRGPEQISEKSTSLIPVAPPVGLTFYGYASLARSSGLQGFLRQGRTIFIVVAGDLIAERFRTLSVESELLVVEDTITALQMVLPLARPASNDTGLGLAGASGAVAADSSRAPDTAGAVNSGARVRPGRRH